jgi:hypothetical protein
MMTSINIHGVNAVSIDRYSHAVNALVFAFHGDVGERNEVTTYGIRPAEAIKIMSLLGTPETYIYYKDKSLSLNQYIEELGVQEVLDKMEEGDGKSIPF